MATNSSPIRAPATLALATKKSWRLPGTTRRFSHPQGRSAVATDYVRYSSGEDDGAAAVSQRPRARRSRRLTAKRREGPRRHYRVERHGDDQRRGIGSRYGRPDPHAIVARPQTLMRARGGALAGLTAFLVAAGIMLVTADTADRTVPSAAAAIPGMAPGTAAPATWRLAFATDFPGNSLDTSTWAECYPWSPSPAGCTNFGNHNEREWYLPSQVRVANGALALVARRTPTAGTDVNGHPKSYTCRSGMVTTYPGVRFRYGIVQVTARLPFGKGLWPAIWLIPADMSWPPEIDIIEHWSTDATSRATLHARDGAQQWGVVATPDADKGWHTFTLHWTRSRISVYYDRTLVLTTTTGIPRQAMYLLLDLANDNDSPGSCSGTMYVRSVDVWEPS